MGKQLIKIDESSGWNAENMIDIAQKYLELGYEVEVKPNVLKTLGGLHKTDYTIIIHKMVDE